MKILLLDDNNDRSLDIEEILQDCFHEDYIETKTLEDAKRKLNNTLFDLVFIDLIVPTGYRNRDLRDTAGYELVKSIYTDLEIQKIPRGVIIISEHLSEIDYLEELKQYPVSIIDTNNPTWKESIKNTIDIFWNSINPIDIAIITAVDVEFSALYNDEWKRDLVDGSITFYRKTIQTKNNKISAILFQAEEKGMVSACMALSKMFKWYLPNMVAMVGICAGNIEKTNFGDIIVATKTCDYSAGSIKDKDKILAFESEPRIVNASNDLLSIFNQYKLDQKLQYDLRKKVNMPQYTNDIKIHTGLMACGPLVVKSERLTKEYIQPFNKNYIGIDMETYAVYYMCEKHNCNNYISIKSVSDHGDVNKTHEHQQFCSRLSAQLLFHYIDNNM